MRERHKTRVVRIGDVAIGGENPIRIQSMCNTKTEDVEATVAQIRALTAAGCEIVRVAVPTVAAAEAIGDIRRQIKIPLVADIHFDYRLALAAMEHGADKIRINPGNIGEDWKLREVVNAAKERNIPIRVGVNSGSLEKDLLQKYGGVTAEGIVESALEKVRRIEELGYENLVISIKSSDVLMCIKAHELLADKTDYPLHIGITEAGTLLRGTVKSAVGLGIILYEGIGDTIRVSLTGDPLEEIKAAREILKSLGLANRVESLVERYSDLDVRVAVMGCVVNGPGEAREADFGVAGGKGAGVLIRKGEVIRTMPEAELLPALEAELQRIRAERR